MDDLSALRHLAGISDSGTTPGGSNISMTGTEKAELMRKHNIKPGTDAWFQLLFSKTYLTGEPPISGK